jgi:hypothetical protein
VVAFFLGVTAIEVAPDAIPRVVDQHSDWPRRIGDASSDEINFGWVV